MKLLTTLIFAAVGFTTSAYAVEEGFYLGLNLGTSNTHNIQRNVRTNNCAVPIPIAPLTNANSKGPAERLFMGYQFNRYAAMEGGITHFANSTYDPGPSAISKPIVKEAALDIVGKGIYPFFETGIDAYAKAGLGILHATTATSFSASDIMSTCTARKTTTTVRPMFGAGVSYDISQNWVVDLSYTRITAASDTKEADLLSLGISYHWADKYCGQFLC